MGKPAASPAPRAANRIEGEKQIYLHPSGWAAAQWWDEEQVDNIVRSVDTLKRKYNIDESRIYITGISDGGTGVYYMALKEPTLWSSYLPLNGSIAVVRSPQNGAGHNTAWWPTEREPYETFVREHARVAHPTKVSWETERTENKSAIYSYEQKEPLGLRRLQQLIETSADERRR